MLLDIPLYYISFTRNHEVEDHYNSWGFKNIHHFPAVDGRQFTPDSLLNERKITIRAYHDLLGDRHQHMALSSIGGVGCTMSHYNLWKLCVEENLPYIIISEEDSRLVKLDREDQAYIEKAIQRKNGIFVSSGIGHYNTFFEGIMWSDKTTFRTHFLSLGFYALNQDACRALMERAFPVDIQTDWYVAHMASTKRVHVTGYTISHQKAHTSSVQDYCIKCRLPTRHIYYRYLVLLLVIIIGVVIYGLKTHE